MLGNCQNLHSIQSDIIEYNISCFILILALNMIFRNPTQCQRTKAQMAQRAEKERTPSRCWKRVHHGRCRINNSQTCQSRCQTDRHQAISTTPQVTINIALVNKGFKTNLNHVDDSGIKSLNHLFNICHSNQCNSP